MNPKVIGIILIIVGLGVGLYFINSGGAKKVSSLLTPPNATTTATTVSVPATSSPSPGFSWSSFFQSLFAVHSFPNIPTLGSLNGGGNGSDNSGSAGTAAANPNLVDATPPASFTIAELSPYYHEIRFSGISQGQIGLSTNAPYDAPTSTIDVTNWEIKTNRGGEFIPQADNIYYPSGAENTEGDIVLTLAPYQSQYVNIFSTSAPVNLRVNECLGYLNATNQFNPGFSYDCPSIDRSQISQFTGACQNYIDSLGNCQAPNFSSYNFPQNDYQCEDYLTGKYTYDWCLDTYASSPDFLGNEWRIWMGSTPLDPYHDNVELLDRNGWLVDYYSY